MGPSVPVKGESPYVLPSPSLVSWLGLACTLLINYAAKHLNDFQLGRRAEAREREREL